jgi:ABC-type taurine transport system ATPase subunit
MITRLRIKNFKRFGDVDIELGQAVVFIGPNNSGKTTALQALALWDAGWRRWNAKRKGSPSTEKRPGVVINRKDLVSIPTPSANLLWRNLHMRDADRRGDRSRIRNVRIEITVDGVTNDRKWSCGLEFDYANEETFYCRPLLVSDGPQTSRMAIPPEINGVRVAYLPPMAGLADREFIRQPGEIGVLLGQGQTAQVMRNLCYQIYERSESGTGFSLPNGGTGSDPIMRDAPRRRTAWQELSDHIVQLFGVKLNPPRYAGETSEITMTYVERGVELDISSSGRGLQQTLLLLAYLYANPKTVLLLDEPDAHLEVLRQREIYHLLTTVADQQGSQVVIASHSEVLLSEAADRDIVVAFLGPKPRRINDRSQVLKALKRIRFDDYYLAQQKGWVLYLEGPTDLAILRAFARILKHPAQAALEAPFLFLAFNQPARVYDHFFGLREACPDLVGMAIFDRLRRRPSQKPGLVLTCWRRREIESYLAREDVLVAYARSGGPGDEFSPAEADHRVEIMDTCIRQIAEARGTIRLPDVWSPDIKASDDFLDPLFENYFEKLGLPNQMRKTNYHVLAQFVPADKIDPEVVEKLNAIVDVAKQAKPAEE